MFSQTTDEKNFYEVNEARQYLKNGSVEKSLKLIDSIIDKNPANPYAYETKGAIFANEFKDYSKAIGYYKKFEEFHPNNGNNLANIGKNYFKLDSTEIGKQYLIKAFKVEPNNEYIISQYAFYISKNIEEKILLYRQAIVIASLKEEKNLNRNSSVLSDIYNNLGYNLYLNEDFLESATIMLKGIEHGREEPKYLNNLGNSLQRLNLLQDALLYYDKALDIEPNKLFSLNGKANTYQKLQQIDSACYYWKRALDKGYKFNEEWRKTWDIEDPVKLISKFCND